MVTSLLSKIIGKRLFHVIPRTPQSGHVSVTGKARTVPPRDHRIAPAGFFIEQNLTFVVTNHHQPTVMAGML